MPYAALDITRIGAAMHDDIIQEAYRFTMISMPNR